MFDSFPACGRQNEPTVRHINSAPCAMLRCSVSWLSSIRMVRPTHTGSPSATSPLVPWSLFCLVLWEDPPLSPRVSQGQLGQSSRRRYIDAHARTHKRHNHASHAHILQFHRCSRLNAQPPSALSLDLEHSFIPTIFHSSNLYSI